MTYAFPEPSETAVQIIVLFVDSDKRIPDFLHLSNCFILKAVHRNVPIEIIGLLWEVLNGIVVNKLKGSKELTFIIHTYHRTQ